MTFAELTTLCFTKIDEKNPLRLPDTPKVVHSPEEEQAVLNEIVDQYAAKSDYSSMLMHAISEVYRTLHEEMGMTREEVQALSPSTPLPPRTNELAEKLRIFPEELMRVDVTLTFEGLRNSRASDELIPEALLTHPHIDFDHRKPPRSNSFLGTLSLNQSKKVDVDFLYWFDGVRFWVYDWVYYEWRDRGHEAPFFNFQITL